VICGFTCCLIAMSLCSSIGEFGRVVMVRCLILFVFVILLFSYFIRYSHSEEQTIYTILVDVFELYLISQSCKNVN